MTERMQTIPVKEFLENMGLMQYFDMFIIKGFDHEKDIVTLDEDDLDAMLISDPDHRHQILQAGEYELSPMSSFGTKFTSSLLKYNVCVGSTSCPSFKSYDYRWGKLFFNRFNWWPL